MNNTRGLYRGKHDDKWVEGNYLHLNDGLEYEIDIIESEEGAFSIEYNAEDGAFIAQRIDGVSFELMSFFDGCEIVGNVHEAQMKL